MKTIFLSLVTFIFLPMFFALGQERIDIIYLKNGDILKGIIIENVPNDHVKIELPGGSLFTVKYIDIQKFGKEKPATDSQPQQQPRQYESTAQPDYQKMMSYEQEKKSSGTAVALSILLPSTGHAYAGNWPRGLLFAAARVGGVVLALTAGLQTKPDPYLLEYFNEYEEHTHITILYYIGFGISAAFAVWEAFDASAEVDRYNEDLHSKIMGKKQFNLNIIPTKDGARLQLSYSF